MSIIGETTKQITSLSNLPIERTTTKAMFSRCKLLVVSSRESIFSSVRLRTSLALEFSSELFGRDLSDGRWIDLPCVV